MKTTESRPCTARPHGKFTAKHSATNFGSSQSTHTSIPFPFDRDFLLT
ncbi:hypothetical protein RE6C_01887 [Rhodopirellula europaea 6C]|uniref:Uncharacterized protein n=1 Tax=Rhodopirellula europaea 6C TaxID=1263867 RepID=M2B556_9BACT|nr:hypothetical protein RE6C_01887 [Rhodopirellula europaea 6C]